MTKPKSYRRGKHIYTKWDKRVREVRQIRPDKGSTFELGKADSSRSSLPAEFSSEEVYANQVRIMHSAGEFFLDFLFVAPQRVWLNSRMVITPRAMRRFSEQLSRRFSNVPKTS